MEAGSDRSKCEGVVNVGGIHVPKPSTSQDDSLLQIAGLIHFLMGSLRRPPSSRRASAVAPAAEAPEEQSDPMKTALVGHGLGIEHLGFVSGGILAPAGAAGIPEKEQTGASGQWR